MKPNLVLDEEDKRIRFRNYSDYSLLISKEDDEVNDEPDLVLVSDEEEEITKEKEQEEKEDTSIFPELTENFDEEIRIDDLAENESSIDPETGEIIQPGISISML